MFPTFIQYKRFACIFSLALLTLNPFVHSGIVLRESSISPADNDYDLMIGELRLNFATGITFTADSNYERESSDEQASFAVSPTFFLDLYWPINPSLELSTSIQLGYDYYLNGPGEDGLTIGGTEDTISYIDLDIALSEDKIVTLSNAFSANIASASIATDDGRTDDSYRRFENSSSVQYTQNLTPLSQLTGSYTFTQIFTESESNTNPIDYQLHNASNEIRAQLNDSLVVSLITTLLSYVYTDKFHNDKYHYKIGPQIIHFSESGLVTRVHMAVNHIDVDNTNTPGTRDNEVTSLNVQGSFNLNTGDFFKHTLTFGHQYATSEASTRDPQNPFSTIPVNFQQVYTLGYKLNYLMHENLSIGFFNSLTHTREADEGNEYYEHRINIMPRYNFNAKYAFTTSYTYSNIFKSRFASFNYDRHEFKIGFRYNF